MMYIKLRNLTKIYNLYGSTPIIPVNDVNLDVFPGDFIIITGRSGSGKTTLLNLMAGLTSPSSGEVLADGIDIKSLTENQLSQLRSQKIGFIFQFPSLLPSLTILENVILPVALSSKPPALPAGKRASELLQTIGLSEKKEAFPGQLSSGELKRAVIARALINSPEVVLADEPTSDLDIQTEQAIMALFSEIHRSGVTCVMVTHSLELVPYATRAFKMQAGFLLPLR